MKTLREELESQIRQNNRMVNDEYLQGILDGRIEMAEFLLELLENGEINA